MSVPKQNKITLNRHKVNMKAKTGPSWTAFYDYTIQDAFYNLNKAGLAVYFYLSCQIPHYYDKKINPDNKRLRPFEFSPEDITQKMSISRDSVLNGWNELIKCGYIQHISGNKYFFTDDLNEEKIEKINKEIEENKILTIDEVYKENKIEPNHIKYDWE